MSNSILKLTFHTFTLGLFVSGLLIVSGCAPREPLQWYRGNLHTHTTHSDGDTQPEGVIQWYRDHGYDFLSITDHNFLLKVEDYSHLQDEGFLLISGNEISDGYEGRSLHLLALGLHDETLKPVGGDGILSTLQNNVSAIRKAGALPVLAHPNFTWAFGAEELIGIEGCVLFEVLNAHPSVNNQGDDTRPGTEEMWDTALSAGKRIYGIGTDDTHKIATYPGKSWTMVRAPELSEPALLEALENGDFYVSTGVELDEYRVTGSAVRIRIREEREVSYRTSFIGEGGEILAESDSVKPKFKLSPGALYVRARIVDSNGKLALTQPVFFVD
ncbi:MAG: CehA/McbA family metallohydrolase [Candidatus Aminicenantaceae bacterium]